MVSPYRPGIRGRMSRRQQIATPPAERRRKKMSFIEIKKPFPKLDWNSFPTNEQGIIVGNRIALDCKESPYLNIVSGYSGLDQIILFITRKANDSQIKLVFGHEPSISSISRIPSPRKLDKEMRDYWLEKGFSPSSNSAVMSAIQAIKNKRVRARIHTERFLHAKAYITDTAAVFGSSNFSKPGLETSRELNGRHLNGSIGYFSINTFFNGCWDRSEDYTGKLLELLERLLRYSTWQEALARSCAALLEGDWAKQLIPPNMKDDFENLWPHQRQGIAQALTVLETQGAVVIADPTGSGKTTTLYSALQEINTIDVKIITTEDPVEYDLNGLIQCNVNPEVGLTYAACLRAILRQDPDVVFVGEIRDGETANIAVEAALTGQLVLSTLHTNDAPSTITRLQNMGTPDYLISAAVSLILAQRLARKNCPDCRIPDDDVTPKALADIGFTSEQASRARASKGKGCPKCKDTGYKGRTGIYEILTVTKPLK